MAEDCGAGVETGWGSMLLTWRGTNMEKSKSNSSVRPGSSFLLKKDWVGICCAADRLVGFADASVELRKKVGLAIGFCVVVVDVGLAVKAERDEDLLTVSLMSSRASLHRGVFMYLTMVCINSSLMKDQVCWSLKLMKVRSALRQMRTHD